MISSRSIGLLAAASMMSLPRGPAMVDVTPLLDPIAIADPPARKLDDWDLQQIEKAEAKRERKAAKIRKEAGNG